MTTLNDASITLKKFYLDAITSHSYPMEPIKRTKQRGYLVPVRTEPKIGRNEPCPCNSGKKYKYCCGR